MSLFGKLVPASALTGVLKTMGITPAKIKEMAKGFTPQMLNGIKKIFESELGHSEFDTTFHLEPDGENFQVMVAAIQFKSETECEVLAAHKLDEIIDAIPDDILNIDNLKG